MILLFAIGSAHSAQFMMSFDEKEEGKKPFEKKALIYIKGKIQKGDARHFENFLKKVKQRKQPIEYADLDSPGGNIIEAIKIGKIIRKNYIRTHVIYDNFCGSACFLIWAAGVERLFYDDRRIGIHRPYFEKDYFKGLTAQEAEFKYTEMSNSVRSYLRDINIPNNVIEKMFNSSSDEIHFLSRQTLRQLRKVPFFDEWIIANCGSLPANEEKDYWELWFKKYYYHETKGKEKLSNAEEFYLNHLKEKIDAHGLCRNRLLFDVQQKIK
jgi:ATP-dependent protease ClpP protease subunit